MDNRSILDRQLPETYGETISELNHTASQSRQWLVRLRKIDIPPLVVRKLVRTIVRMDKDFDELRMQVPQIGEKPSLKRTIYTLAEHPGSYQVLQQVGDLVTIAATSNNVDWLRQP